VGIDRSVLFEFFSWRISQGVGVERGKSMCMMFTYICICVDNALTIVRFGPVVHSYFPRNAYRSEGISQ